MNIEKLKTLCVPVSERLPEKGKCFVIDNHDRFKESYFTGVEFYEQDFITITHWLDPEQLTTKKAAIELARQAYDDGVCYENDGDVDEWITQNENKL